MRLPQLRLKPREERRLKAGHLWVFSNEVDVAATPLTEFQPGDPAVVVDSSGRSLGTAYVNPASLICARLVSRRAGQPLDGGVIRARLGRAAGIRERAFGGSPYYRLAFGESDGLPGLVVDRFGVHLVAQIATAGMERLEPEVVAALREMLEPASLLLKNDVGIRRMEGLELYVEPAIGEVPERVEVVENGSRFLAPLTTGQKTGWFYDHRQNRDRLRRYVRGASVLDVFSYVGGWGVQAAAAGAREVVCVDSSEAALELVEVNAALNGVEDRVSALRADAFEALERLAGDGRRFDVVVLDPPAFVKRRKDIRQASKAYVRLNRLALAVLEPGGILVSASCSFHFSRDALKDAILRASRDARRELRILEEGHQAADHPVHPAIPETAYLKCFVLNDSAEF